MFHMGLWTYDQVEHTFVDTMVSVHIIGSKMSIGHFVDLYRGYGFYERMIKIEAECPGANVILHKHGRLPQVNLIPYVFIKRVAGRSINENAIMH